MNRAELVIIMDRVAVDCRGNVDPEKVELWWDHLQGVDADVAADAAEDFLDSDHDGFMPHLGLFNKFIADVLRRRSRDADAAAVGLPSPRAGCPRCGGSVWYQADPIAKANGVTGEVHHYEQWKACESCDPIAADACIRYRHERAMAARFRPWETRDPEAVSSSLSEARSSLITDPSGF